MLKIIMEDLPEGSVAAMYQDGEDALILINRGLSDDIRCSAVNDLLGTIRAQHPLPIRTASRLSVVA